MTTVSELGRLAAVLPVAVLAPIAIQGLSPTIWRYAATALLAAYAVTPLFGDHEALVLVVAALLVSFVLKPGKPKCPMPDVDVAVRGLVALICLIGSLLAVDAAATWTAIANTLDDNGVAIAVSGALTAVFLGGAVVGIVLRPFASTLNEMNGGDGSVPSLKTAGTYIGWFERAVFFAFIVAGQPQAAAVALAAKSFARFPSLSEHREGFAEYFLIGTLASVAIATAAAIATRSILGLDPL